METDWEKYLNASINPGWSKMSRINNSESCLVCGRRSDGMAVGEPGSPWSPPRLGWYCNECGPVTAWKVVFMDPRKLDTIEKRVAIKLAEDICHAGEPFEIPAEEMPQFISWLIQEFAEAMRKEVAGVQS